MAQNVQDGRGYRLLSAPVTAYTVGTLATVNLVQGITGQYVNAQDNLYLTYTGVGAVPFTPADNEGQTLQPGRGFFWLLYDQNIDSETVSGGPLGTGTSDSFVIPERQLTATGTPLAATTTVVFTAATPDKFYMIGNPFARALSASAISVPGGLQGGLVSAYRPNPAGYVQIFQVPPGAEQSALAVWQGVFAETVDPAPPTFTFDFAAAVPATPPFVGRAAPTDALALTLAGTTTAGEATLDQAATVRLTSDATTGWDALDASKLTPPSDVYALVAPVGARDGAAYRQGVLSLPAGSTADVTLAFTTTTAGTFTLTAEATGLPADATVRDLTTGTVARLADGLTFTSAATDWTERFVVSFGRTTAGEGGTAAATSLSAPRPNPVTGSASLTLRLAAPERVTATVVDALGRTVATLFDGEAAAGTDLSLDVDASRLAPGVYVVRVQGATFAETRRLTVVR